MGRKKPAPQPLSLPDPSSTTAASSTIATTSRRSHDSHPLSADFETAPSTSTAQSPSDSRSPVSITASASASTRASPYSSKFAQKRPQTARAVPRSADTESFDRLSPSQPSVVDGPKAQTPTAYPHIATAYSSQPSLPPRSAQPDSKKSKGGFFHFSKPSKSANQFPSHAHQVSAGSARGEPQLRGNQGPTASWQGDSPQPVPTYDTQKLQKLDSSRSELSLSSQGDRESSSTSNPTRKSKPSPFGLLTRTKSHRDREVTSANETHDPMPALVTHSAMERTDSPPPRTAPVAHERAFRGMMDSSVRNRSEDRLPTRQGNMSRENNRDREMRDPRGLPGPARESGGSTFLSGLKNSSTKAAGMFGRSLFGKGHRSASTLEKEAPLDDEHYELKVLNLPLAAQTRKTRISKRLEDSRDKTEFWMPAFPWRAIDYLNYKGCEVEGLYRVPGSGPQIKKWQRKFDEQLDVNLFEEEDLYDINIIGSMLKAWLRELPDELFPKASQERIARECAGAETVPQMLVDELSNLSPFQYYLLFAITCHLSLLLAHSDKNKMDFRNLCICFQPCMKIDAFCFKFLVCDWRDCWKGCKNEAAYIEQEYLLLDQPPPRGLSQPQESDRSEPDDRRQNPPRTPSPDYSSRRSEQSFRSAGEYPETSSQAAVKGSESNNGVVSHDSTVSTTITINREREREHYKTAELRRLSPIQPLSPLGFS